MRIPRRCRSRSARGNRVSAAPQHTRWVAGADEAVGVGDLEGAVGEELGVPAGLVELLVVPSAQQDEVVEAGWPAVGDPLDVVAVAPGGWRVAAVEAALAVADHQGGPHGGGEDAGGGADVEDARAAVGEDAVHGAVAAVAL